MLSQAQSVWSSAEPWDGQTWSWDWDFFISSARALRIYLFDHGTIPLWNLYMCGGQPELPNPQSFALTWPSLFIYLFPPAVAIMMLWLVMSVVGAWSTAGLLRLSGVSPAISWIFSLALVFSGYFGAHFNQGHATFAFFHLIPLVAFVAARDLERQSKGKHGKGLLAWPVVFASFLLFSAPSVQALVYGFPLLLVLWIAFRAPMRTLMSMLIGMMLASYKFMPVLFQSLARKRADIFLEAYPPSILQKTLFTFVSQPELMWESYQHPWRFYGWWEYAAFISPVLMLCGICSIFMLPQRRDKLLVSGVILMLAGAILALGNGYWVERFGMVPFIRSVRVFPRFQFLLLSGATWAGALFAQQCWNWLAGRKALPVLLRQRHLMAVALAALVALPSLVQTFVMVKGVTAFSDSAIVERLNLGPGVKAMQSSGQLWLSRRAFSLPGILSAQDLVVRSKHGIVEECYDPFFPVKEEFRRPSPTLIYPFASPVNVTLAEIDATSFAVNVPPGLEQDLILNLSLIPDAKIDPVPVLTRAGLSFAREQVSGRKIHFSVNMQDMMFGVYLSLGAAVFCGVVFFGERLRR